MVKASTMVGPPVTADCVAVQYHPDWPFGDLMVIDAVVSNGRYGAQFETGISNGGLTAFPGGDRWRWESRLFQGRYDFAPAVERPVYGALDRGRYLQGPAIRFGSAFLRLRPEAIERSTFCFPDSTFESDLVVGAENLASVKARADVADRDVLDDYIEAHVHGGIDVHHDVEAIVLDPSFRGSAVEQAALASGCDLRRHPGFRADTDQLNPAYRGPEFVELARSLGQELTPAVIGHAARSGAYDLQSLKRVWHLLARFGRP